MMTEPLFHSRKLVSREMLLKIRRIKFSHDSLLFYEPFDLGYLTVNHSIIDQIEEET